VHGYRQWCVAMPDQSSRNNCSMAEWFPRKSRWCLIEVAGNRST